MKAKIIDGDVPRKGILIVGIVTVLALAVPLTAMQFSNDLDWKPEDFVIIGCLVFGTGLLYLWLASMARSRRAKTIIAATLLVGLLYVWAELAVGIFTRLGS
ncbi:MAG: hypothetical protein JWM37_685 [Candidatus Saccharibacteria bacterium]|nr:hypothetical protein [Candidatus Saccharibacteria bacterium]